MPRASPAWPHWSSDRLRFPLNLRGALIERAVDLAHQAGVPVVFDVNLRPTLWSDLTSARPACEEVAQTQHAGQT